MMVMKKMRREDTSRHGNSREAVFHGSLYEMRDKEMVAKIMQGDISKRQAEDCDIFFALEPPLIAV